MKRVKVTKEAYIDNRRVHVGEIIAVPDKFKASWAEKVTVKAAPKKASKKKAKKAPKKASKKKAG